MALPLFSQFVLGEPPALKCFLKELQVRRVLNNLNIALTAHSLGANNGGVFQAQAQIEGSESTGTVRLSLAWRSYKSREDRCMHFGVDNNA